MAGHGYEAYLDHASEDIFIVILDTGIWPESSSFDDTGTPPLPSLWQGSCEEGVDFSTSMCNRKLVGAKTFSKGMAEVGIPEEITSARDRDGHGTHAASIAAGSHVPNASLFGYAAGMARGMAPRARIAVYKVCWELGCFGSDILAGIDAAIADGVDILSLSLGGGPVPYKNDPISMGSFAAVDHGIVVACSGGNDGLERGLVGNVAPWVITVGAGTLDRRFPAYVSLGNGKKYAGVSIYSGEGKGTKMRSIVYNVSKGAVVGSSNLCLPGTLDPNLVRGKVVICDMGQISRVEKGLVVEKARGAAMILVDAVAEGVELITDSHLLPTVGVGRTAGDLIRKIRAVISESDGCSFGETVLDVKPSPQVDAFSSRGPNAVAPEILKPDFIGPG
ncbi:subtilisin-like protease SBT1.8 [Magnolia sinica]|uniref:subtilisin-like protease SBT1.8 n=1 Tax=Magnolia sinica TaxID=86752 RepID=UPI002658A94B|nr:subtilisin-like protease SBT1.8 [Magnolia sinica]